MKYLKTTGVIAIVIIMSTILSLSPQNNYKDGIIGILLLTCIFVLCRLWGVKWRDIWGGD